MQIRPTSPDELDAVLELLAEAFVDEPDVVDLVRDLAADESFIAELSVGAFDDDAIVGHVLFTRAFIETPDGDAPALSLAPLGVVPSEQNRGVGSALVRAGLDACRARGERVVLVLGHPRYYPRFGFVPAIPLGIVPPHPVDIAEAWMVLELEPGALAGIEGAVRFGAPLQDPRYW